MVDKEALHSFERNDLKAVVRAVLAVAEYLHDVPRENLAVLPLFVAAKDGYLKALLDDLLLTCSVHVVDDKRSDLHGGLGRRLGLELTFEKGYVHLRVMLKIELIGLVALLILLVGGLIDGDFPFAPIKPPFACSSLIFLFITSVGFFHLLLIGVIRLRHRCPPR